MDAPNRIRELRNAQGWSQQKLAEAVGVTKMTISDLERGAMNLTQHYMQRIGTALGCPAADLLPISDNPFFLSPAERAMVERMRMASEEQLVQLGKLADVAVPWKPKDPNSEAA